MFYLLFEFASASGSNVRELWNFHFLASACVLPHTPWAAPSPHARWSYTDARPHDSAQTAALQEKQTLILKI